MASQSFLQSIQSSAQPTIFMVSVSSGMVLEQALLLLPASYLLRMQVQVAVGQVTSKHLYVTLTMVPAFSLCLCQDTIQTLLSLTVIHSATFAVLEAAVVVAKYKFT